MLWDTKESFIFIMDESFWDVQELEEYGVVFDQPVTPNLHRLMETSAYGKAVNESFVPALAVLAEETSAMRMYLNVLEKMRSGVESRVGETLRLAEQLFDPAQMLLPYDFRVFPRDEAPLAGISHKEALALELLVGLDDLGELVSHVLSLSCL